MNKKQLIFTAITFVALLLIAFSVLKKEDDSWEKGEFANKTPLIENLDINKVAKFSIFNSSSRLQLAINNEKWTVHNRNSYPANYTKIRKFIIKISELKIAQKLRMKKTAYSSVKLLPPGDDKQAKNTGTLIELYDAQGEILQSLLLGDFHYAESKGPASFGPPRKDGRYVMIPDSDTPVLINDPLSEATPEPALWLDRDFVKIPYFKSFTRLDCKGKKLITISRKSPKSPYVIEGMKNTQRPNHRKIHETTATLSRLHFSDVHSLKTPIKKTGLDKADVLEITSFGGISYKMKLAIKQKSAFAKFAISLDMPKQRKVGEKEKPENKEKLAKEFQAKLKVARNQVRKDQLFTKWIYEMPLTEAKKLLASKQELLIEEQAPPTIMGQ